MNNKERFIDIILMEQEQKFNRKHISYKHISYATYKIATIETYLIYFLLFIKDGQLQ